MNSDVSAQQNAFIAIGGLSGSGKSTLARSLEASLTVSGHDVVRLNSDEVRKELWGVDHATELPREAYTAEFSSKTYDEIDVRIEDALAKGQSVIVDIVFVSEAGREKMENFANENGAVFAGLWLDAPAEVLRERADNRINDASDADSKIVDLQLTFNLGHIEWDRFDATDSPAAILHRVEDFLRDRGVELKETSPDSENGQYIQKKHEI